MKTVSGWPGIDKRPYVNAWQMGETIYEAFHKARNESVVQLLRRRNGGKLRSHAMKPVGTGQLSLATFFYAIQHNWQLY